MRVQRVKLAHALHAAQSRMTILMLKRNALAKDASKKKKKYI